MNRVIAVVFCVALAACSSNPTAKPNGTTSTKKSAIGDVLVRDSFFKPKNFATRAGKKLVWAWVGTSLSHSVTADDGSFDSGDAKSSGTFSHTFAKAGSYRYHCKIHGGLAGVGMSGVITVT